MFWVPRGFRWHCMWCTVGHLEVEASPNFKMVMKGPVMDPAQENTTKLSLNKAHH